MIQRQPAFLRGEQQELTQQAFPTQFSIAETALGRSVGVSAQAVAETHSLLEKRLKIAGSQAKPISVRTPAGVDMRSALTGCSAHTCFPAKTCRDHLLKLPLAVSRRNLPRPGGWRARPCGWAHRPTAHRELLLVSCCRSASLEAGGASPPRRPQSLQQRETGPVTTALGAPPLRDSAAAPPRRPAADSAPTTCPPDRAALAAASRRWSA